MYMYIYLSIGIYTKYLFTCRFSSRCTIRVNIICIHIIDGVIRCARVCVHIFFGLSQDVIEIEVKTVPMATLLLLGLFIRLTS